MRPFGRLLFLLAALASTLALAQTSPPVPQAAPPKKPKKVYSEDDLRNLSGSGISVVGEEERKPAKKKPAKETATDEPSLQAEMTASEPPPESDCKTYSWAMIVATAVGMQGVPLARDYWAERLFGHPDCSNNIPVLSRLVSSIEGEHLLSDGTRVRLRARFVSTLAQAADLIAAGRDGRAYIVVWSGQPYLMDGGNYIDWDNGTTYVIKDLRLVDPYTRRTATFVKDQSDLTQIQGSIDIQLVPRR